MEQLYPSWNKLPAEILLKIFKFAAIQHVQKYSLNIALVCKSWKIPAQSVLYLHIIIRNFWQLQKFYEIVKHSPHIGSMVKTLVLKIQEESKSNNVRILDILTNLLSEYLTHLESFYEADFYTYQHILTALSNSKLKRLTRLPSPNYQMDNNDFIKYASCAFLMRERLKGVCIYDSFSGIRRKDVNKLALIKFEKLYNNLDQFSKLTEIKIRRKTNDGVQVLEHVVESCRFLRTIELELYSNDDDNENSYTQANNTTSLDMVSQYIPNFDINTLIVNLYTSTLSTCNILLYIIQKFQQLKEIDLSFFGGGEILVTPYVAVQFLEYLLKIDKIDVYNLAMSETDITEVIGSVWSSTSKPGMNNINLTYNSSSENSTNLDIEKDSDEEVIFSLTSFHSIPDWKPCMDFIRKYGKFIGNLNFTFNGMYGDHLPENLLRHICTYFSSLQNLHINECTLKKSLYTLDSYCKNSIGKLTLENCHLEQGYLEELSRTLSEIKQLQLIETKSRNRKDDENYIRINMPHSKINLIKWGTSYFIATYVSIFVVAESNYYYYRIMSSTGKSEQIDKREFEEEKKRDSREKALDEDYSYEYYSYEDYSDEEGSDEEGSDVQDSDENEGYNYDARQFAFICCQTKPDFEVVFAKCNIAYGLSS